MDTFCQLTAQKRLVIIAIRLSYPAFEAFLVGISLNRPQLSEEQTLALEVITYVGLSLSLFGALLSVIAYVIILYVERQTSSYHQQLSH